MPFPLCNAIITTERRKTMKRQQTIFAAVGLLLMALLFTSCSQTPSSSGETTVATSAVMAMSEAVSAAEKKAAGVTEIATNKYEVKSFTADDGTVITGNFEIDENGTVLNAELTMKVKGTGQELRFSLTSSQSGTEATINDKPVEEEIKKTMTKIQREAFGAFLKGMDEALDELNDGILEDWLEDKYEDRRPGNYDIINNPWLTGSVTVGYEERGDDDTEVIGADVKINALPLPFGGEVNGSFNLSRREDDETAVANITIKGFSELDDHLYINLSEVRIDATINEGEKWDDDYFSFKGTIEGQYTVNGEAHSIYFNGSIIGDDDDHYHFSEYTLRIDGENVAIGRQYR